VILLCKNTDRTDQSPRTLNDLFWPIPPLPPEIKKFPLVTSDNSPGDELPSATRSSSFSRVYLGER